MLLDAFGQAVGAHQGIENGENVAAIIGHAGKDVAQLRVPLRFAVPFGQDCRGNFDVPPQLIRRMTAQEQAVEKSRFPLRKVEIVDDFDGNELWHRGHREKCSLLKNLSASSRTEGILPRCG